MTASAPVRRIAVIGAGAAGLVTAREMLRAGLQPTVFEADGDVGGIWRYTHETETDPLGQVGTHIHGSLYASLRTNLPRDLMAFTDFPFEARRPVGSDGRPDGKEGTDELPRFPGHAAVQGYLQHFAEHFGLQPHIRFGTRVRAVRASTSADGPLPMHWQLTSATDREPQALHTEAFAAVAICNGHYSAPRVPPLPGEATFPGRRMHSHNYREPAPFAGLTVALWGMSASGNDLARELSAVARRVYWCGAGTPLLNAAPPSQPGDVLQRRGEVAGLGSDGRVQLADGTFTEPVDVFVYCTGYHYRYPFLDDDLLRVDDNFVQPLYRDLLHCEHDTLALVGVPFRVVPFPLFEVQARYLARLWSGGFQAPPSVTRFAALGARWKALRDAGVKQRLWHQRTIDCYDYLDELADEAGVTRVPDWHRQLNRAFSAHVQRTPGNYRDVAFPLVAREPGVR